jgi:hypothetical protein
MLCKAKWRLAIRTTATQASCWLECKGSYLLNLTAPCQSLQLSTVGISRQWRNGCDGKPVWSNIVSLTTNLVLKPRAFYFRCCIRSPEGHVLQLQWNLSCTDPDFTDFRCYGVVPNVSPSRGYARHARTHESAGARTHTHTHTHTDYSLLRTAIPPYSMQNENFTVLLNGFPRDTEKVIRAHLVSYGPAVFNCQLFSSRSVKHGTRIGNLCQPQGTLCVCVYTITYWITKTGAPYNFTETWSLAQREDQRQCMRTGCYQEHIQT